MEKCDCLNHCGDDPHLQTRRAAPCTHRIAHDLAIKDKRWLNPQFSPETRLLYAVERIGGLENDCADLLAQLTSLQAKLEAAEKDAARYRFWRKFYSSGFVLQLPTMAAIFRPARPKVEMFGDDYEGKIDVAIDSAIAASKEVGK
jgi:hypothetical protein